MLGLVVLGNLLGWTYSAPPFRLSSRGLGEIVLTFVAGFLLPATGSLSMRGALDGVGAVFLFPLLCYGLVFILSVEIPDLEVDRQGEKQTWVARTLCGLLRQPVDRRPATRIATAIVISLALFAVLLDVYLIFMIFG